MTIKHDEMIRFLKLAPDRAHAGYRHTKDYDAHAASAAIRAEAEASDTARVDYVLPTKEMRAALEAEGVPMPGEARLLELSRTYNERLERARKWENKEGFSWYMLFKELDDVSSSES